LDGTDTDFIKNFNEEILVGKGIGRALKVYRERGMLGKTIAFGRNKDK